MTSNPNPIKTCSCGAVFYEIPKDVIKHDSGDALEGYYWNCTVCQSTLFIRKSFALTKQVIKAASLIFVLLFSHVSLADWFCTDESSVRTSDSVKACGIGVGFDEVSARQAAFTSAKTEFSNICEMSADCNGHVVTVNPMRTECHKDRAVITCYRMVEFRISETLVREQQAIQDRQVIKAAKNPLDAYWENFAQEQLAAQQMREKLWEAQQAK